MTLHPPSHPSAAVPSTLHRPFGVTLLAGLHALATLFMVPLVFLIIQHAPVALGGMAPWIIYLLMIGLLGGSLLLVGGIAYGVWMLQRRTYYLTLLLYGIASITTIVEMFQQHKPLSTGLIVSSSIVVYLLLPHTKAAFQGKQA